MLKSSKTMKVKTYWILYFTLFMLMNQAFSQQVESPLYFRSFFDTQKANKLLKQSMVYSNSGNVYNLMNLRAFLGANNVVISKGIDKEVIEYQKLIINNLIKSAEISKDIPR